ncbi:hypothetical protein N7507_008039 [Penicillium longicatenatum]|nr:hypothetical protein N7507_008039 [Penicillium longicatenatum]
MYFPTFSMVHIWEAISGQFPVSSLSPQTPHLPLHHSIWDHIVPSANLHFHPCYDNFECARLAVPLNWNNASDSEVAVALIKIPAKVDVSDPRYGGSVLINPGIHYARILHNGWHDNSKPGVSGGPGGSGVNLARLHGKNIQTIIDSPLSPDDPESKFEKYFDIVAFDPRGVGFTTPSFTCFVNSQQRLFWQIASATDGLPGSSNMAFSRTWARKKALAEVCDKVGDERISTRINTPVVAMDLAAIVKALAVWMEERTGNCHQESNKLQYWGFSYGTLLGETFASMYPQLVGRLVLDGVVDSDLHYAGTFDRDIYDADAIMERFSVYCHRAGPLKCPLFSEKGPEYILSSLDTIVAYSKNTTKSVVSAHGPEIVTYNDIQRIIRDSLYQPFKEFEGLAHALHNLANGDGSIIANRKQVSSLFFEPTDYAEETVGAISCTDGLDQTNMTKEDARKMSQRFPGSGLIEQVSEGHLSLSTPSTCTAKAVRVYFQNGTLPAHGTLCQVYDRPFGLPGEREKPLQKGDDELLKALRSIASQMW